MRRKQWVAALVAACASVSVLAACGDDADDTSGNGGAATSTASGAAGGGESQAKVDEGKEPVVIALNALKTQAVDLLTPYEAGAQAAAKQINAEGGFGGRKVVIESCNTAYQPATAAVCARETVKKEPVASIGCEPTWGTSGLPTLAKAKIPSIGCPNSEADYENEYSFPITPGVSGGQRAMARYLCTRDDVKKVAVFTQDVPFQHEQAPKTIPPVLEECGKSAEITYYPLTGGDLLPHVSKAARSKPDFVIAWGGGAIAVQIFKLFGQAGIPAEKIFGPGNAMAYEQVLKPAGNAMEGAFGAIETASWSDTADAGVEQYLSAMEGAGVDPRDSNPQTGYMSVMSIFTAAKEIGFDAFDSGSLAEWLGTANGVAIPGGRQIVNPGPEDAPQIKQPYLQIVQWKDGKLNVVTEGTDEGWVNGF